MLNVFHLIIGLVLGTVITYYVTGTPEAPPAQPAEVTEIQDAVASGHYILRELTMQGDEIDPALCANDLWRNLIFTNIYRVRMATLELNRLLEENRMPTVDNRQEAHYRKRILDAAINQIWGDIQLPENQQNQERLHCVEYAKELKVFTPEELAQIDRGNVYEELQARRAEVSELEAKEAAASAGDSQ